MHVVLATVGPCTSTPRGTPGTQSSYAPKQLCMMYTMLIFVYDSIVTLCILQADTRLEHALLSLPE